MPTDTVTVSTIQLRPQAPNAELARQELLKGNPSAAYSALAGEQEPQATVMCNGPLVSLSFVVPASETPRVGERFDVMIRKVPNITPVDLDETEE